MTREELYKICDETNTRKSGIDYLLAYYQSSCNMTEQEAIDYTIGFLRMGLQNRLNFSEKIMMRYENLFYLR